MPNASLPSLWWRWSTLWVWLGSLALLGAAYFPALVLDSTFIEYNRLPVDGLPNVDLYTENSVKRAPKVASFLAPHDGPPSRSGWEAPVVYHPIYQYQIHQWKEGHWPWWDAETGLGFPFFAIGHEILFNPLALLFYAIPTLWWDLIYLFWMSACSVFAFRWLRLFPVSLSVAMAIGIAAPLIGPLAVSTSFGGETLAYCFFPLLIWSTESFVRNPRAWNIGGIALAVHLLLTCGQPEAPLALISFAWLYFLVRCWELKAPRQRLMLWGGLFILLLFWTSPQWGHLLHNVSLGELHRLKVGHLYLPIDALLGWPIRYVGGWFDQALHPDLDKIAQVGHWGMVGTLCGLGMLLCRKHVTWGSHLFWLWPLAYLLKNYGFFPWLAENLGRIPPYDGMWIFRYFAPTLVLCQWILTAFFLTFLLNQPRETRRKLALWAAVATLVIVALALGTMAWRAQGDWLSAGWKLASKRAGLALFWGMLLAGCLRWGKSKGGVVLVLCLILLIECWEGVPRRKYSPRLEPYEAKSYVTFLQQQEGVFRVMSLGNFLFPRNSMAVGLNNLKFYGGLTPHGMLDFLAPLHESQHFLDLTWQGRPEVLQKILNGLNVRYLIERAPNRPQTVALDQFLPSEAWRMVYQDDFAQIWENREVLPRAFLVEQVRVVPTIEELGEYNVQTFGEHLEEAVIVASEGTPSWLKTLSQTATRGLTPAEALPPQSPNQFRFRTNHSRPALLVISQTFYPGWKAWINGQPTEIYQANRLLQGIYVPAGTQEIELEYTPFFWPQLRWVALAGGLGLLGLFVWGARRKLVESSI